MKESILKVINLYHDSLYVSMEHIFRQKTTEKCKIYYEVIRKMCENILKQYIIIPFSEKETIEKNLIYFDVKDFIHTFFLSNNYFEQKKIINFKKHIMLIKFYINDLYKALNKTLTEI